MSRYNKIAIFWILCISLACETVYDADIDKIDNVMVVDARIVSGNSENYIQLNESHGYNDIKEGYRGIVGASVTLISSNGDETNLDEFGQGKFLLKTVLNPDLNYKLKIDYQGESYESGFESVPRVPEIDTVYGIAGTKIIKQDGDNDVNNYREKFGIQLYADITNEKESPYFRFTTRKILQYTYPVEVREQGSGPPSVIIETMYGWFSYFPHDYFNLASPPEYSVSTDILKHPLYFLEQKAMLDTGQTFAGWILILYQHGLSKNAYSYYKDLNNQLLAEGRLFDPVYVQARNNLKCTTNPKLFILGNFEISTKSESRFFVKFLSGKKDYLIKPIPYYYNITENGEQLGEVPDFWERELKSYPNE